jgi:hypothetical protein
MDRATQARREQEAQDRLQKAALGIAKIAGMKAADFAELDTPAPVALRFLQRSEALADILEKAEMRLKAKKAKPETQPEATP